MVRLALGVWLVGSAAVLVIAAWKIGAAIARLTERRGRW